MYVGQSRQINQ